MKLRYRTTLMAAAFIVLGAGTALSDTNYVAILNGANESPPNASPATGVCNMVLNAAQTELSYTLTFSGLVAAQTAAHFHNDDIGNPSPNGPVVRGIGVGSPIAGIWKNTDAQPLTAAMVAELLAGRIYVNVHSQTFPGGEIRGTVREEVVPVEPTTWGKVKAFYANVAD